MSFEIRTCGREDAELILVQPVGEYEFAAMEREASLIRELSGREDFMLAEVKVDRWNKDLSPWPAEPVFGAEPFGSGAADTLARLCGEVLPTLGAGTDGRAFYLGGYSLGGLFALWSAYRTPAFAGVAAVSPSVWFPGFAAYARTEQLQTGAVYLSLGDREEKAKNPVLAQVGNEIRALHGFLAEEGLPCVLEWNQGNHFRDPELRTAKGFAWLLRRRAEQLERIEYYEGLLRETRQALSDDLSAEGLAAAREAVRGLEAYYVSTEWKQDFRDDEAGYLPKSLKRGVLSEDGVDRLLEDFSEREAENRPGTG